MIYLISVLFFINILNSQVTMENTIHQFKVEDIYGDVFDFSNLKGKKIMIVNTASKCGLTPQYEKLQSLHEKYGDEKFIIVGFPSNNFLFQEKRRIAKSILIRGQLFSYQDFKRN